MSPHVSPPARYSGALRALTTGSLVACYLLVALGDTVRVTESGMGCRSWPLCNGHLGLVGNVHALLEQSHRYLAAVVTALVVATFVATWRSARGDRLVFGASLGALALIGAQVALGAITVFSHNAGWSVALHLAGAWLVLGAVTVTAAGTWRAAGRARSQLAGQPGPSPARQPGTRPAAPAGRLSVASAITLFALSVTGMLVLQDGASTACPSWPLCGRGDGPPGLIALQYAHRAMALATTILIIAVAVQTWRSGRVRMADRTLAAATLVLLAGTAAAGALVATSGASATWQDLHLVVGSGLWISVVALAALSARQARPAGREPATAVSVARSR